MRARIEIAKEEEKMYRSWNHSYNTKSDPVILRLEKESHRTLMELHEVRRRGRQIRSHWSQELEALETRRMTLTEILKRMESELKDKDTGYYGKILAMSFGERKVKWKKAIRLESTLCKLMHQILAKQHELKILKNSAKSVQQLYKEHKSRNKDEFYSFDAMAVQLEAHRLSLVAIYDDVFAQQHRFLALLQDRKTEGTITNYVPPKSTSLPPIQVLHVNRKHQFSIEDLDASPNSVNSTGSKEDYKSAMNVLDDVSLGSAPQIPMHEVQKNHSASQRKEDISQQAPREENVINVPKAMSARERRREIEHKRLSQGLGSRIPQWSRPTTLEDTAGAISHRQRMRELEALRKSVRVKTFEPTDTDTPQNDDKLRLRRAGHWAKSRSP